MSNLDDLDDLLSGMAELLERAGYRAQGQVARGAIDARKREDATLLRTLLNSNSFWGGAGSITDAVLVTPRDEIRMNELILRLIETMRELGIATHPWIPRREEGARIRIEYWQRRES